MQLVMCLNPRKIRNPHNGCFYEVDCGRCKECKLRHARRLFDMLYQFKRTNLVECVMVTLTYDNSHVPYLNKSELIQAMDDGSMPSIHRDIDYRYFISHGVRKCKVYRSLSYPFERLSKFDFPSQVLQLPALVKNHSRGVVPIFFKDRVGILYNNDVKVLFKSLRRAGHIFNYYCCGEYGSEKQLFRPHWHIMFYLPKGYNIKSFVSDIKKYWRYSPAWNIVALSTVKAEKYISLYITKTSNYPDALYKLQQRFTQCSHLISRAIDFGLSQLDCNLQKHTIVQGVDVPSFPSKRDCHNLYPVTKNSFIPLTWLSIFQSFFVTPKKFPRYAFNKMSHRLSDMIDYSIAASEFYTKLASLQLRFALTDAPTIFSYDKLESLHKYRLRVDYGIDDKVVISYLLRYRPPIFDDSLINTFNFKSHLNSLQYELNK